MHYHYEPSGPVSGDYCDLILSEEEPRDLFCLLGDVAGKGVAASMLMTHLHAMFRSFLTLGLPVEQLMRRANRVFCESTISGHFATLVCGRAGPSGEVEICNAGHCPPLALLNGEVTPVEASGFPLGLFSDGQYTATRVLLAPGDTLFLYTDGLSEAVGRSTAEYGVGRLAQFVRERQALSPQQLIAACLQDLGGFLSGTPMTDDLTVMVVRRTQLDS